MADQNPQGASLNKNMNDQTALRAFVDDLIKVKPDVVVDEKIFLK